MNSKPIWIALSIFLILLLSGCVQIDLNLKVGSDGKGTATMLLDLSALSGFSGLGGTVTTQDYSKENICSTLKKSESDPETESIGSVLDTSQWGDRTCEGIDDYKAKLVWKDIDLQQNGNLKITESFLSKKFDFQFNASQADANQTSQLPSAKALGFRVDLTVEMPGTIQSTSVGTISEDKKSVQIDLLDSTVVKNGIRIQSEESNSLPILIGGIVVIALIGGVAYFFFLRKP